MEIPVHSGVREDSSMRAQSFGSEMGVHSLSRGTSSIRAPSYFVFVAQ